MAQGLESFAAAHGAFTVALVSLVLSVGVGFVRSAPLRRFLILVLPLLVALALYKAPVWRGADASEYSAWILAVVLPWAAAGWAAAVLGCLAARRMLASSGSSGRGRCELALCYSALGVALTTVGSWRLAALCCVGALGHGLWCFVVGRSASGTATSRRSPPDGDRAGSPDRE